MGAITDEAKDKIRAILHKGADMEADEIISFTEQLQVACPDEHDGAREWAEKQAKAFADARVELTKKFAETVKAKMGL